MKSCELGERKRSIVYGCTSQPSNIKTWVPIGLLPIHVKWSPVDQFGAFNAHYGVKSTRNSKFRNAYYLRALMSDEWELCLYTLNSIVSHLWQPKCTGWYGVCGVNMDVWYYRISVAYDIMEQHKGDVRIIWIRPHVTYTSLGGCNVYYVWEPRAFMTPPKNPLVYERLYV